MSLNSRVREKIDSLPLPIMGLALVYFFMLLWCSPLDITQLNCGDKAFSMLYSSVYFERLHPSPVYMMLGWLVTRLPIQDGMALSIFLSILPAVGSVVCVYYIVKKKSSNGYAPLVASLALMSSWMFVSQVVKVEVYPLVAFMLIFAYALLVYEKTRMAAVVFGFASIVHWITAFIAIFALFIHRSDLRSKWYYMLPIPVVIMIFWYGFMPSYNPDMNQSVLFLVQVGWCAGPLSEVPGNMIRTIPVVLSTVTIAWIPTLAFFCKDFRKAVPFIFIILIPISYMIVTVADSGYMQMSVAIPFLAVASGMGMEHIRKYKIERAIVFGLIVVLITVPLVWKIDNNPTTARDMILQLDDVPDGSYIMALRVYDGDTDTYGGSVAYLVEYYNRHSGRDLFAVNLGYLWQGETFDKGKQEIMDRGIVIPNIDDMTGGTMEEQLENTKNALSLCNPGKTFYYYEIVDLEEMVCELKEWE